jgi:hypothetical protein
MAPENKQGKAVALSRVSYWLLPAAAERAWLAALITRLANRFGGPVFAPHLTVYSGPAPRAAEPGRILQEAAGQGAGELRLRCTGLDFTDKFTKACFLGFAPEPRLLRLSATLRAASSSPAAEYRLQPHLSLFYGSLRDSERQLIRELVELPAAVRFDGVTAMATSARTTSAAAVASWRQLASHRL